MNRYETGPDSAGQSGDLQGLEGDEDSTSESVIELIEEGNSLEASLVNGIENAPAADERGLRTKEVPEDDVNAEYLSSKENER